MFTEKSSRTVTVAVVAALVGFGVDYARGFVLESVEKSSKCRQCVGDGLRKVRGYVPMAGPRLFMTGIRRGWLTVSCTSAATCRKGVENALNSPNVFNKSWLVPSQQAEKDEVDWSLLPLANVWRTFSDRSFLTLASDTLLESIQGRVGSDASDGVRCQRICPLALALMRLQLFLDSVPFQAVLKRDTSQHENNGDIKKLLGLRTVSLRRLVVELCARHMPNEDKGASPAWPPTDIFPLVKSLLLIEIQNVLLQKGMGDTGKRASGSAMDIVLSCMETLGEFGYLCTVMGAGDSWVAGPDNACSLTSLIESVFQTAFWEIVFEGKLWNWDSVCLSFQRRWADCLHAHLIFHIAQLFALYPEIGAEHKRWVQSVAVPASVLVTRARAHRLLHWIGSPLSPDLADPRFRFLSKDRCVVFLTDAERHILRVLEALTADSVDTGLGLLKTLELLHIVDQARQVLVTHSAQGWATDPKVEEFNRTRSTTTKKEERYSFFTGISRQFSTSSVSKASVAHWDIMRRELRSRATGPEELKGDATGGDCVQGFLRAATAEKIAVLKDVLTKKEKKSWSQVFEKSGKAHLAFEWLMYGLRFAEEFAWGKEIVEFFEKRPDVFWMGLFLCPSGAAHFYDAAPCVVNISPTLVVSGLSACLGNLNHSLLSAFNVGVENGEYAGVSFKGIALEKESLGVISPGSLKHVRRWLEKRGVTLGKRSNISVSEKVHERLLAGALDFRDRFNKKDSLKFWNRCLVRELQVLMELSVQTQKVFPLEIFESHYGGILLLAILQQGFASGPSGAVSHELQKLSADGKEKEQTQCEGEADIVPLVSFSSPVEELLATRRVRRSLTGTEKYEVALQEARDWSKGLQILANVTADVLRRDRGDCNAIEKRKADGGESANLPGWMFQVWQISRIMQQHIAQTLVQEKHVPHPETDEARRAALQETLTLSASSGVPQATSATAFVPPSTLYYNAKRLQYNVESALLRNLGTLWQEASQCPYRCVLQCFSFRAWPYPEGVYPLYQAPDGGVVSTVEDPVNALLRPAKNALLEEIPVSTQQQRPIDVILIHGMRGAGLKTWKWLQYEPAEFRLSAKNTSMNIINKKEDPIHEKKTLGSRSFLLNVFDPGSYCQLPLEKVQLKPSSIDPLSRLRFTNGFFQQAAQTDKAQELLSLAFGNQQPEPGTDATWHFHWPQLFIAPFLPNGSRIIALDFEAPLFHKDGLLKLQMPQRDEDVVTAASPIGEEGSADLSAGQSGGGSGVSALRAYRGGPKQHGPPSKGRVGTEHDELAVSLFPLNSMSMSLDQLSELLWTRLRCAGVGSSFSRTAPGETSQPKGSDIVWVAHSMGGLILKMALLKNPDLAARTRAVIFFGVPHFGSPMASEFDVLERVVASYCKELHPSRFRDRLSVLNASFQTLCQRHHIHVVSFAETRKTPLPYLSKVVPGYHRFIVPPQFADPGYGAFVRIPETNHTRLCCLARPDDRIHLVLKAMGLSGGSSRTSFRAPAADTGSAP